jgi:hypothetical protein
MMAVAICGQSCIEQAQSPIAEQGGFLKHMLSAFFKYLELPKKRREPGASSEPVIVREPVECDPDKVVVVVAPSEEEIASCDHGFAYSAELLANIVMHTPMSNALLRELPDATKERAEILMMAVTIFLQIMRVLNNGTGDAWNNESIGSRIALALSTSVASKFVMDATPFGSMYTLSCALRPGELACSSQQLNDFIFDYECRVIHSVPIYRCYFNHYSWACEFVSEYARVADVEKLQNVCLFTAYNATELLPLYCSQGEHLVGPALGILSIECIIQSGACECEYTPLQEHAHDTYKMAIDMATVAATTDSKRMQLCLGFPFSDPVSVERRATTQMNFRKTKLKLEEECRRCLPPRNW